MGPIWDLGEPLKKPAPVGIFPSHRIMGVKQKITLTFHEPYPGYPRSTASNERLASPSRYPGYKVVHSHGELKKIKFPGCTRFKHASLAFNMVNYAPCANDLTEILREDDVALPRPFVLTVQSEMVGVAPSGDQYQ